MTQNWLILNNQQSIDILYISYIVYLNKSSTQHFDFPNMHILMK